MPKFKTPEEMNILIDKLNKGEIIWDDIPEELRKIRKENKNSKVSSNDPD